MLRTFITRQWGLRYPVIGAPMAYTAGGRLARAITDAGGLGMIGVGPRDSAEWIEKESRLAGEGGRKFGIGMMAWLLDTKPEILDAAIAQRPSLISISFGSVGKFEGKVHSAGIALASQVNNRRAALAAAAQGADVIVAQGTEAGGHTGVVSTLPLLQIVLDSVDKPVIAAGGVASARGLAAVLAAGAAGAWIGTALLLCEEANVTPEARNRIQRAEETDTILSRVFDRVNKLAWPHEYPGRSLRNAFVEQWDGREKELVEDREEVARFRRGAEAKDYDITSIYAGEAVGLLHDRRPAAEIVEALGTGAESILRETASSVLAETMASA